MASPYAKMHGQPLWGEDSHFTVLPRLVQRCYMVIATQPNMTHCGVLPLNQRRWSQLSPDDTTEDFNAALDVLADAEYVVIDARTDELWVRTWMKWDGLLQVHNGAKGVARAIDSVLSKSLAQRCRTEALKHCKEEHRTLFQAPTEPPPKGLRSPTSEATATHTPTVDNNSSEPLPATTDVYSAAVAAAIEIRRSGKRIVDNAAWEPKTRAGIEKDFGKTIRLLLIGGCTPDEAAYHALGGTQPQPKAVRPRSPHNESCVCDGTGWLPVDPDDESRTSYSRPCTEPQTEATIIPLRGAS